MATIDKEKIREIVLKLIKTDEDFRLSLAGALGYYEILNELKKLREDFNKLYLEHNKRFSRIELELGSLCESFYCKALWEELREEIKERGEKIIMKRRNYRINESDIDLFVLTDKTVYVVEVKIKPKHEDIGALLAKAELVKKHFPDKKIVSILAGTMIGREIEEYARIKGIKIYYY